MTEASDNGVKGRAPAKARALSLLCLVFLLVPNFNIIDILPDFVAYLILTRFFGRYADYAPYFAEARESFSRLALVTLLKLPATLIMMMSMGSGMDVVPLFTLVFVSIELMLLYPAVSSAFAALMHLGERGVMSSPLATFSYFGKQTRPDSARALTYIFVTVKGVLNFLPDIFLLSHSTETNAEMLEALMIRSVFPIATAISAGSVLILGILWAIMLYRYAMAIAKEGGLADAARVLAGEARLRELEGERSVRRILRTATLLMLSSLLCFDITFTELNHGVNMLPHFLFAIFIIGVGSSMCESESDRRKLIVSGIAYSAVSIMTHVLLLSFSKNHYYSDLGSIRAADTAYLYVSIGAIIEFICFIFFISVYARVLVGYVIKHTTLSLTDERYSRQDTEFCKKMKTKGYIFAYFPLLIALLKLIEVFIRADVRYILPEGTSAADVSTIVTSSAPWFGFLILGVTIAYAFYAYYFTNEVKEEVRLKYSNEKQSFE